LCAVFAGLSHDELLLLLLVLVATAAAAALVVANRLTISLAPVYVGALPVSADHRRRTGDRVRGGWRSPRSTSRSPC